MKLSPDFEKPFREYQQLVDRGRDPRESLATTILGDSAYTNRVRMPKYNGDVDMLREPKVAIKYANAWGLSTSKYAHQLKVDYLGNIAFAMERKRRVTIDKSLGRYGDGDGRLISGIVRDHFPDAVRLHTYLSKTRSSLFR